MKTAIVVFPGTNCDLDTFKALKYLNFNVEFISHNNNDIKKYNLIILPGGFSYGDCIASGRIAKFSPLVLELKNYIKSKMGFVLGICNGFQILCEAGFLPGALTYNITNKFICKNVNLEINMNSFLKKTQNIIKTKNITLPIAHFEGRFYASEEQLNRIENKNMAFLKYVNNENGSQNSIAGLYNKENNIMGLMPHPERAVFEYSCNQNGVLFFEIIKSVM